MKKYLCKQFGYPHETEPYLWCNQDIGNGDRCGSFEFQRIEIFKLSPDRDVYQDGGSDEQ